MSDSYTYRVAVYLKGDELVPEELTAQLAANPTQSHRKGDKWLTSSNKEVVEKTGLWALSIKANAGDLPSLLAELGSRIRVKGTSLTEMPGVEEAYLDVFIAADADSDGGGTCEFDLSEQCILAIRELGLPMRFTIAVVNE